MTVTGRRRDARVHASRDDAIAAAYASGGYTLKDIGAHFELHPSRSRIVRAAERKAALGKKQDLTPSLDPILGRAQRGLGLAGNGGSFGRGSAD